MRKPKPSVWPAQNALAAALIGFVVQANAQPLAKVRALGLHEDGEVVYYYTVTNAMPDRPIMAFTIGCKTDEDRQIGGELMLAPSGAHPVPDPDGVIASSWATR